MQAGYVLSIGRIGVVVTDGVEEVILDVAASERDSRLPLVVDVGGDFFDEGASIGSLHLLGPSERRRHARSLEGASRGSFLELGLAVGSVDHFLERTNALKGPRDADPVGEVHGALEAREVGATIRDDGAFAFDARLERRQRAEANGRRRSEGPRGVHEVGVVVVVLLLVLTTALAAPVLLLLALLSLLLLLLPLQALLLLVAKL